MNERRTVLSCLLRSIAVAAFAGGAASCSPSDSAYSAVLELVVVLSIGFAAVSVGLVMLSLGWAAASKAYKGEAAVESGPWQTTFFACMVALYGVLVAGLFVFMSFRLDRGAREAAEAVAIEEARTVATSAVEASMKRVQEIVAQVAEGSLSLEPQTAVDLQIGPPSTFSLDGQTRLWVRFQTAEAGNYEIDVLGGGTGDLDSLLLVDPIVYLYELADDANDQGPAFIRAIAENDDGGEGLNARLQRLLSADRTYYLGVTTYNEGVEGRVEIRVDFVAPSDE